VITGTKNSGNRPLVSIIVPVYNGEKYLRESLDSILGQTYRNIEILVMDDASTDSTPEIIASYGDKVCRIRQPQNKGQFGNVNDGIGLAAGKYIAVYHADDLYDKKIIERSVEFLESHPEAGAVFCYDIFINAEGREYNRLAIPKELQTETCLDHATVLNSILTYKNRFLPTPGAMVRSSVYRDLGYFRGEDFQIASDLEMWLRIASKHKIGLLHEYLFSYRHGHENSSQIYYRVRTEEERQFLILDEHLGTGGESLVTRKAMRAYRAHRAEDNLMVAINHYILKNKKAARSFLRRVKIKHLLGSHVVQRGRLLVLFLMLQILLRVPRISFLADLFYRRWHMKTYPA
jgi:glycosyltransferase involved in cell wall biosynthesis